MPVVYIDVIWAVNLVMDAVILLTTAWIAKYPIALKRICLGGLIGSAYSLLLFFPPLSILTSWPGKAVVSLLMVAVAIPCGTWLRLLRASVLFYVITFVFAGAALALHFAVPGTSVGSGVIAGRKLAFVSSLSSLALLIAIPVAALAIKYTMARVRIERIRAGSLKDVSVRVGDTTVELTGLVDTGNQLRDPLTQQPVCLVDLDAATPLLPRSLAERFAAGDDPLTALSGLHDEDVQTRFAIIPYRGAGGSSGITLAFRPDAVLIREGSGVRVCPPCLFGLNPQPLSRDKAFQAILHTDLITGDEILHEKSAAATTQVTAQHEISAPLDSDSR